MDCCGKKNKEKKNNGFLTGLFYGLAPHIGCISFIIFSVLGATTATAILIPLLLNPYFFYILIGLSLLFATISAFFYLKKQRVFHYQKTNGGLGFSFSLSKLKTNWKYLLTLYGTTISINLILFMLVFPVLTTLDSEEKISFTAIADVFWGKEENTEKLLPILFLEVAIPCSGHAPLITRELKTISGVENVNYRFPNRFIVNYNPEETSKEEILGLGVFKIYEATVK